VGLVGCEGKEKARHKNMLFGGVYRHTVYVHYFKYIRQGALPSYSV